MQLATGQAAWQIEHANAPKQRSGSMTAIVLGAFFRGPDIILVHMCICNYTGVRGSLLAARSYGLVRVLSPESRAPSPEPPVPSPESRAPSPDKLVLDGMSRRRVA